MKKAQKIIIKKVEINIYIGSEEKGKARKWIKRLEKILEWFGF